MSFLDSAAHHLRSLSQYNGRPEPFISTYNDKRPKMYFWKNIIKVDKKKINNEKRNKTKEVTLFWPQTSEVMFLVLFSRREVNLIVRRWQQGRLDDSIGAVSWITVTNAHFCAGQAMNTAALILETFWGLTWALLISIKISSKNIY